MDDARSWGAFSSSAPVGGITALCFGCGFATGAVVPNKASVTVFSNARSEGDAAANLLLAANPSIAITPVLNFLSSTTPATRRMVPTAASQATTYAWRPSLVRGPEGKESVLSARVTPGTLELLGGNPILGRTLESTDSSHCESCVVLSNSLWRSEFHGDSRVIGQPLYLNGRRLEIVGVLPAQFRFPGLNIGLYTPFEMGLHPRLPNFEWSGALLFVPAGTAVAQNQVQSYINQAGGLPSNIKVDVLSLTDLEYQALESCAVLILLAVLLVLSLNWRAVAGLHASGAYRRLPEFWRWWLFFIIKSTLLLVAVLIASLELVQMVVATLGVNVQEYAAAR